MQIWRISHFLYVKDRLQKLSNDQQFAKKSLKIPKGYNPYIEEEQTTQWPKEKKYKRTSNNLENIHIKLKIESHEPNKKLG